MKKTLHFLLLIMAIVMMAMSPQRMWAELELTKPASGDGSKESPYQIGTAGELMWFMTEASKASWGEMIAYYADLTADIVVNKGVLKEDGTLNGTPANQWVMPGFFYGTFNGKGHTISGIYNPTYNNGSGMFVYNCGTIRNLGIIDSYFGHDDYYTATFAAYNYGTITDCFSFATIVGTDYNSGIAAVSEHYEISNCFFAGKITSTAETSAPICSDYDDDDEEEQTDPVVHNNYFLESCLNEGMTNLRSTSVTLDEMKSGKVAYLLQAGRSKNVWGQTLTGENKQDYPVLYGDAVYADKLECDGKTPADGAVFANNEPDNIEHANHNDEDNDGFCNVCNRLTVTEAPVLVTAENYAELGLTDEYIGYKAISNLGQLAGFAEEMEAPVTKTNVGAIIIEELVPVQPQEVPVPAKASRRQDMSNGSHHANAKNATSRMSAARKLSAPRKVETPEAVDTIKYVLTEDVVVNDNLLDDNGKLRSGITISNLKEWNTPSLTKQDSETADNTPIIFDGNGHTISGIYQRAGRKTDYEDYSITNYGFVADISKNSKVMNLGIIDSYFGCDAFDIFYAGSIASYSEGVIDNCWSDAALNIISGSEEYTGGIVGGAYGGKITGCTYSGTIYGDNYIEAGGIAYYAGCAAEDSLIISDCHFAGKVISSDDDDNSCNFSGITNEIKGKGKIKIDKCYADGRIVNNCNHMYLMGLVNYIFECTGSQYVISNCYNAITVDNKSDYHYYYNGLVNNAYMDWGGNEGAENKMECCFTYADYSDAHHRVQFINYKDDNSVFEYSNCAYLTEYESETEETNMLLNAEDFASGELAYIYNDVNNDVVWYQELGVDKHPVLMGDDFTVVCLDEEKGYYNRERKFDEYAIVDGEEYDLQRKFRVGTLTYSRTFANTTYNALYLPFAMSYSDWSDKADVYRLLNVFESDNDNNGTIDEWVLRVVKLKAGASTKPNTPYVIKPKEEGDIEITLSDVNLAPAEEKDYWCASTDYMFVFKGSYAEKAIPADKYFFLSTTGGLQYAAEQVTLKAQRWYMGIYDKESEELVAPSTFNPQAAPAKAIRIVCDDDNTATGISQMENGEWRTENGKYLENGRIVIIKNGMKCSVTGQSIK